MRPVAENLAEVTGRIEGACARAGRDPDDVRLVAVSKHVSLDRIREAVDAGVADVGENRAQELRDKVEALGTAVRWHFVGAIQTNKVRYLDPVELTHSVARMREAKAIHRRAEAVERPFDILVEVNMSREPTKQGIAPEKVGSFLDGLAAYPAIRPRGLMMVAPKAENPEDVRWVFAQMRHLRDRHRAVHSGLEELSMGMTQDLEVAIEEGATMVRVGRAIFREE